MESSEVGLEIQRIERLLRRETVALAREALARVSLRVADMSRSFVKSKLERDLHILGTRIFDMASSEVVVEVSEQSYVQQANIDFSESTMLLVDHNNLTAHLIEDRQQEVMHLAQSIGQVNEIFRDIGNLVNQQQTMIDNIESNVGNTTANTEHARDELQSAVVKQGSSLSWLFWIFMILFVITGGCAIAYAWKR